MLLCVCVGKGISGLGVNDSKGQLVDIISVRDLRGIGVKAEHFERLWHTVKAYKEEVRRDFRRQTPPAPIHVTENDTVEHVVRAMDDGNIHRVFVVDKTEHGGVKATHVITQRDVMRFLLFKSRLYTSLNPHLHKAHPPRGLSHSLALPCSHVCSGLGAHLGGGAAALRRSAWEADGGSAR